MKTKGFACSPFVSYDLITGLCVDGNTVLAYAGILLGSRFEQLDRYVGPVSVATFVIIALLYGWRVLTWKPKG